MAKRELPTPDELRKLLRYEPETGELFWLARDETISHNRHWNRRWAGKKALTAISGGYRCGFVLRHHLRVHRVVWALYHGEWPEDEIDHINHDRSDNRIKNLRAVSKRENTLNKLPPKNNTSGTVGVHRNPKSKRWHARIGIANKTVHIGSFPTEEDAIRARKNAERRLGYHKNHGQH